MTTTDTGLSLRAFARLLGVSDKAIRKAIAAGRLGDAVGLTSDGKPSIVNPDLAAERWKATTRTGVGSVRTGADRSAESAGSARRPPVEVEPDRAPVSSLVEAQQRATEERARKLRLENDAREGRLVPLERVRREAFDASRTIRDSMLNIPDRLSGELAADTDPTVIWRKLDAAIRAALASAADTLAGTVVH